MSDYIAVNRAFQQDEESSLMNQQLAFYQLGNPKEFVSSHVVVLPEPEPEEVEEEVTTKEEGVENNSDSDSDSDSDSSDLDLDDLDDSEDDEETKAMMAAKADQIRAIHARQAAKAHKAKSNLTLDVKPIGSETDMDQLEADVRAIDMEGVKWLGGTFLDVAFGVQKLRIMCQITDQLVPSPDIIRDIIEEFDEVQSTDIFAFQMA